MNAEEMWQKAKLSGEYDAYSFGVKANELASLVKNGIKTATASLYLFYELENEDLPKVGDYSVILDEDNKAVCIIKNTKVYVTPFNKVSEEHAYKEGEGDRSLNAWRKLHQDFFSNELKSINKEFNETMDVVLEEFELVYK